MIQEICIFVMGYCLAILVKQAKIVSISMSQMKAIDLAMSEAEEIQKKIENDHSSEMIDRQIKSMAKLERFIAYKKILKKFDYIIW